jgi:hypothetical protein
MVNVGDEHVLHEGRVPDMELWRTFERWLERQTSYRLGGDDTPEGVQLPRAVADTSPQISGQLRYYY